MNNSLTISMDFIKKLKQQIEAILPLITDKIPKKYRKALPGPEELKRLLD